MKKNKLKAIKPIVLKEKSVMIGTPMYNGQCFHGYTSSIIENVLDLRNNGIGAYWYFVANESLIPRGRNYIVDYFMKSSCTHLMFIDADISFPSTSIRELLSADEDIVCAAYPKKFIDWNRINYVGSQVRGPYVNLKDYASSYVINFMDNTAEQKANNRGLVEARHSGTGFMLISRNVFEKMQPDLPQARASNFGANNSWYTEYFRTDIDEDGVFQSEDWFFCNKWRDIGGKIYLNLNIKLNHIGTYVFEGDILATGANVT
jgi:hypothetical protein